MLAIKLAVSVLLVIGFWTVASWTMPLTRGGLLAEWPRLGSDFGFTVAVFLAMLLSFFLGWWCAVDQVYRCRVCARKLRMPQMEGNYSRVMRDGVPHTKYICTFGHGRLTVPDVHLSANRTPLFRWVGYGTLWEDLMHAELDDQD
ncbi:MAG: hypothetical protein ACRD0Y_00875 [Terriglobales bacterium]